MDVQRKAERLALTAIVRAIALGFDGCMVLTNPAVSWSTGFGSNDLKLRARSQVPG